MLLTVNGSHSVRTWVVLHVCVEGTGVVVHVGGRVASHMGPVCLLPPLVCCVSPGVVTLFQVSRETFRRVVGDPEELLKADPEAHKRYVSIKL
jgi:hypothetical protein